MKTAEQLLLNLRAHDITLWVDDGKLRFRAPQDALTAALRAEIAQHRNEILDLLAQSSAPAAVHQTIKLAQRPARLPLSFAQERLWFLDQLESNSAVYNVPEAWRLVGALNVAALEQSLQELVRRHESLRTTFVEVDGVPEQVIHPDMTLALSIVDLRGDDRTVQENEVERLTTAEAVRPFDLSRDPMMRATLLQLGSQVSAAVTLNGNSTNEQIPLAEEQEHILLLTVHHIATDGWSMGMLLRELTVLYAAFQQGQASPLPEPAVQYADFALWQRGYVQGGEVERQLRYWKEILADAPDLLQLPTDRPRPVQQSFQGDVVPVRLDATLTQRLNRLSQEQGTTLYMTLLAAFQVFLFRYSGQSDIVVGSPIANRNRQEIEQIVGFFVNTLALRAKLVDDNDRPLTFLELLAQLQTTTQTAYDHQDLPFERLVDALRLPRALNHNPLFQVMFALQNMPTESLSLADLRVYPALFTVQTTRFDIELHFWETAGGLEGYCIFSTALFDRSTIERMMDHFQTLLFSIVEQPMASIAALPLLIEQERQQLLHVGRGTTMAYPTAKGIHHLFEEQANRTPDAVALRFGQAQLTYRALNERANQLAHHLIAQGIQPNALVGVSVERSVEMVVALLATLKAGGVYLPLDPTYPADRLRFMVDDANITVIVAGQGTRSQLPTTAAIIIDPASATGSTTNPAIHCTSTETAYVLYTSGSTGQPKGVAVPHRTLCNLITWQACESHAAECTLQFSPMNFDVSLQEVFATLCVGGTLVLVDEETRRDPYALLAYLRSEKITRLFLPFIALQQLAEAAEGAMPPTLREVMTAGEQLQITAAIRAWFQGSECMLVNQYGPTESHVASAHNLAGDATTWPTLPSIGRPIANTELYILDAHGVPVPIGVNGELHIGGAAVAEGYLQRPELTRARFIANPFGVGKLYKTGDLCRYRPDGTIDFLGRIDAQVKVRGFRVELGEIEASLSQHPDVQEAVVVARAAQGERRLVAYVVKQETTKQTERVDGDLAATAEEPMALVMRRYLQSKLPDYMVPAFFVIVDALPLTPSGKVDRQALPDPAVDALRATATYVAPTTPIEAQLTTIWQAVLGIEQVGIHANFFDVGGHSLMVIKVRQLLQQTFGHTLPVADLFRYPTIHQLAQHLSQVEPAQTTVLAASQTRAAQQRKALQQRRQRLQRT